MYTIIEDCSPYYIRFKFNGMDKIIDICRTELAKVERNRNFQATDLSESACSLILNLLPMAQNVNLMKRRVSFFITQAGWKHFAHKDGYDHRISINIPIKILDDACVTKWYSDAELSEHQLEIMEPKVNKAMRNLPSCNTDLHTPLKSVVLQPDECVLFNTDIWHDFDNRLSKHERVVLTLRAINPGQIYFDDAKRMIFG